MQTLLSDGEKTTGIKETEIQSPFPLSFYDTALPQDTSVTHLM